MAYERATCTCCGKHVAIDDCLTVHFLDGRFMHRCCYWQNVLTDYLELERWSEAFGVSTEHMKQSLFGNTARMTQTIEPQVRTAPKFRRLLNLRGHQGVPRW